MTEEIIIAEQAHLASLFPDAATPTDIVTRATEVANALAPIVDKKGLYRQIGASKHVYVEAWTMLGSMLGVFAIPMAPEAIIEDDKVVGYKCYVEARTLGGQIVGAATGICRRDEQNWGNRPQHALESMAETRGASKALRRPLNFIMKLAGYNTTPAEEMPNDDGDGYGGGGATTAAKPAKAAQKAQKAAEAPTPAPAAPAPQAAPAPPQQAETPPAAAPAPEPEVIEAQNTYVTRLRDLMDKGRHDSGEDPWKKMLGTAIKELDIDRDQFKQMMVDGKGDWVSQLPENKAKDLFEMLLPIVDPDAAIAAMELPVG